MRNTSYLTLLITASSTCFSTASSLAATVYNLTTDWSDTSNPNGVWTYRQDVTTLPHRNDLGNIDAWTTPQEAWGAPRIPVLFKSNGTEQFPHDWLAGDVITHTAEGGGEVNVLWTSPATGTIDIALKLWDGRDIGRDNDYTLLHNATLIASGDVTGTRAAPFTTSTLGLPVSAGDTIALFLFKDAPQTFGDYAGLDLTITLEPRNDVIVPLPSAALAGSILLTTLATTRPRARTRPR